ncbi:MAG: TIGR00270 family protein [Nanoarchaeota archaeon]|nr:TIGR00270 family protein [Nanoarchaeota archaeon]
MQCDLCGAKTENLFRAIVEGTELNVCKDCAKYGKIIEKKPIKVEEKRQFTKPAEPEKEIIQVIVPDFAQRIKKKRESLGLKQKEFAKKTSEKESLIHNIETGSFEPSISLAKKLEKFLKIKLIEDYEEEHKKGSKTKTEGFTVGDLIKIKK